MDGPSVRLQYQCPLVWLKDRIRFGPIAQQHVLDRSRQVVSFEAGSIFALVRWVANEFGITFSRIDILRVVKEGQRYSTVPCVWPRGEILLRISG
jgi:Protein of unknown function (DUF2840)